MNNSKVRIYDLSKELNLENRDLLAICDQINITVKSHSSTISESDAERIKVAAAKYNPNQEQKLKDKSKQEILAIHHKDQEKEDSQAVLIAPPKPPLKSDQKNKKNSSENKESTGSGLAKPKLIKPSLKNKSEKSEKPQLKEKLTVKKSRDQGESPKNKTNEVSETPKPKEKVALKKPLRPPAAITPTKVKDDDYETDLDLDEDIETNIPVVDDLDEDTGLEKPKKNKLKLKRPNPPHTGKKSKWEEEEEEKAQASKTSKTKNKRRQLLIDEDEEDLESELGSVALPSSVSISIARPAKPPSMSENKATTAPTSKQKPQQRRGKTEQRERRQQKSAVPQKAEIITLSGSLTVRELADLMGVPDTEIIKTLFFKGIPVSVTQTLDFETAKMVAEEMEVLVETEQEKAAATKETEMLDASDLDSLQHRPPVVTIMGHVDHGKTTLLDSIRNAKVAQGEAGGITQHIGAYHVDVEHNGKMEQIVFLDTPGHEAFTAMRARGARVTDIAILVVAADDGVQPQTREAISHARAAGVPILVAVNKVDKPGAEPDRVKQELTELGLVPEEWGGDTIMVPVSALKGENLDTLLEMILLVAEVGELSANPDRKAKGTVIEANLDRSRGPVATLLVQNGTLRVGDVIVAGCVFGKIRAMIDDRGDKVEAATPSFAVEVLGLNDVPAAGDEFDVYDSEKEARAIAESRQENQRQSRLQQAMSSRRVSLTTLSAQAQEGELKELNLILKADVQGSVEAILGSLQQLPQNEVQIRVLLSSAGEVTETDVDLASASGAVIIGFNTTLAPGARSAADREGVDIREYNIIYKLLDDIQAAMEGLLDPEEVEEPLGEAEVRAVFSIGKGAVAGCYVLSGKIVRNRSLRVKRGNQVVFDGNLDTLKRMKDDVKEVNAGFECGINSQKFNDWQEGDIIQVYQMVFKRRTLSK